MKNLFLCFFSFAILTASWANAAVTPLGISIVPPVQFPNASFTVAGVRLNVLWGAHTNVYGFDIGALGNVTTHQMTGIQVAGLVNWNHGESRPVGLQLAGVMNSNMNKMHLVGVQAAGIVNSNRSEASALGIIIAPVNLTEHTKVMGLEAGLFNKAREVYGFQIGVINQTQNLHGLQIGLLNFNTQGLFAVSPVLNIGF